MTLKEIIQSKTFRGILYGLGIAVVLLLVFQVGTFVGYKKALFSYQWGNNYYRNFGGPGGSRHEFLREFEGKDLIGGHGVSGSILRLDASSVVMKGSDNVEKIILVNKDTFIRKGSDTIHITDLKVNDQIVVIGSPNDAGQIEARLIRVLPLMPLSPGVSPSAPPSASGLPSARSAVLHSVLFQTQKS